MTIFDPEVAQLFDLLGAGGFPSLAKQTVEQARRYYREKSARFGGPLTPMAEIADLEAIGPEGPIPIRLYRPDGVTDTGPAFLYVHGGGWVIGDLESHDRVCRNIAAAARCRVIAVDYRLAPEHPFPAGFDDVTAASRWIALNAQSLDILPGRIGIGGDSAGGSMAAAACIAARKEGPAFRCQVLIYPSTDSTPDVRKRPSRIFYGQIPPFTSEVIRWFVKNYLPHGAPDLRDWRLSPLYAESLAELPPALVLTAGCDPLHDEGKAYADRLREEGVPVIYRDFPGQIHGFLEFGGVLPAAAAAIAEIAAFLRQYL